MTKRITSAVGEPVNNWITRKYPSLQKIEGKYCSLGKSDFARDHTILYDAFSLDSDPLIWEYLFHNRPCDREEFDKWFENILKRDDLQFYTVFEKKSNRPVGLGSYLRVDPSNGVIEIGNLHFSSLLRKSRMATEAVFLLINYVMTDLQYRRCEWKCDSLNEVSRKSAKRFGFTYEGTFRQAVVYKNRNRDTAWYSIIDKEWPSLSAAFQMWLDKSNFTKEGIQIKKLSEFMRNKQF